MKIELRGVEQLARDLKLIDDWRLPYAIAAAGTAVAFIVRKNQHEVMDKRFDKPAPVTLRSILVDKATKTNPARVYMRDDWGKGVPADKYLQAEVFGGPRTHKKFEKALIRRGLMRPTQYAIPGAGVRLNQYGNIAGSLIVKILSGLGAHRESGSMMNATGSKRSQRKGNAQRYFADAAGVWERVGKRIKPILVFTDGAPMYRRRMPFFEVAQNSVAAHYGREFEKAWGSISSRLPAQR